MPCKYWVSYWVVIQPMKGEACSMMTTLEMQDETHPYTPSTPELQFTKEVLYRYRYMRTRVKSLHYSTLVALLESRLLVWSVLTFHIFGHVENKGHGMVSKCGEEQQVESSIASKLLDYCWRGLNFTRKHDRRLAMLLYPCGIHPTHYQQMKWHYPTCNGVAAW